MSLLNFMRWLDLSIENPTSQGHLKADVFRNKPCDQIELSSDKMEGLTSTHAHYPAYDLSLEVTSEDVKKTSASLGELRIKLRQSWRITY
jgi:hypothetical protein